MHGHASRVCYEIADTHTALLTVWLLLQLGSCTADLSGLLRQGRDLSDLLLELPVLRGPPDRQPGSTRPAAPALAPSQPTSRPQGPVQLGTLVLRLINMGQEPGHVAGAGAADAAASTPGTPSNKVSTCCSMFLWQNAQLVPVVLMCLEAQDVAQRFEAAWGQPDMLFVVQVCLRAAPLQPGSPVAKELRGGSSSPFAVDWQHNSGSGAGAGDGGPQALDVSASTDAAQAAADIIGLEQRKVCWCRASVGHTSQTGSVHCCQQHCHQAH